MLKPLVVLTKHRYIALYWFVAPQLRTLEFDGDFVLPASERFMLADTWGAMWPARWLFNVEGK